tara:strand:+ start:1586 stop:1765 length:180 start_codon:yes stop_codon:yes gene_type:complete
MVLSNCYIITLQTQTIMPHTHNTTPASRPSFMGVNAGFRLAVAALCLGLLWLAVIWALV